MQGTPYFGNLEWICPHQSCLKSSTVIQGGLMLSSPVEAAPIKMSLIKVITRQVAEIFIQSDPERFWLNSQIIQPTKQKTNCLMG